MNYYYRVYGLDIYSELELPELIPGQPHQEDVTVRFGKVPEHLPEVRGSGVLFEATTNDFLFKFKGIGRYRVQSGKRIIIQADKEAIPDEIRLVLLGSCIGALLHQRGILALHGSAITDGHQTVILSGPSGAGKSTLAAAFFELGYSVIADDISVIGYNEKQQFIVEHGIPHLKLWKDVLAHFNQSDDFAKVRPRLEKYRKPIPLSEEGGTRLTRMVILNPSNSTDFKYTEILGLGKFHQLRDHTYRLQFIDKLDQTEAHFHNLSLLVNSIQMFQANRPQNLQKVVEFAENLAEFIFKD
ncbi:MAG: hypothetical protein ACWGNV_00025 [Bacteroidales bacterium]